MLGVGRGLFDGDGGLVEAGDEAAALPRMMAMAVQALAQQSADAETREAVGQDSALGKFDGEAHVGISVRGGQGMKGDVAR